MREVKRLIRRARGIRRPMKVIGKSEKAARIGAQMIQERRWERDKKIKREHNFKKATLARQEQVKAINAEKERQAAIAEVRRENLKKARKARQKNVTRS